MLQFERDARDRGFCRIAGLDEAGRGPLAGPVVAAAVCFPYGADIPPVQDSKTLTPRERQDLIAPIFERAVVGIGCVEASVIDRINILQATFFAMQLALHHMHPEPDLLLIDGPYRLAVAAAQLGIRGGDGRSASIAAASIVAKVHRDGLMQCYHAIYPEYGFDRHKGYGTRRHLEALRRLGPCPLHRRTFAGVVTAFCKSTG